MSYYPAFLDLRGKKVVIVGGGVVAQRKCETLVQYGAELYLAARELTPVLKDYVDQGRVRFLGTEFREPDLDGAMLAIAATDDPDLNRRVSLSAMKKGVFVNVVDQPADCTFIVPSILRRGDLVIAVSTSGKSPALAKQLREKLGEQFGPEYKTYLHLMGRLREEILSKSLAPRRGGEIFRELVRSDLLDSIRAGEWGRVTSTLNRILGTDLTVEDVQGFSGPSES
jgi:precorrin-2 dehydrogenase / sirohydrochlorin ferrochelatase